jgi:hypothetical protein
MGDAAGSPIEVVVVDRIHPLEVLPVPAASPTHRSPTSNAAYPALSAGRSVRVLGDSRPCVEAEVQSRPDVDGERASTEVVCERQAGRTPVGSRLDV